MLYIAVFILFVAIFLFVYALLHILCHGKITIKNRIGQVKDINGERQEEVEVTSFSDRILTPFYDSICGFLIKLTPRHKIGILNKKLERAGLLKNITLEKWLYYKSMMAIIAFLAFGILSYMIEANILKSILLSVFIMLLVITFLNFYLSRRFEMRKKLIVRDLPYTLDLITVSVEAGASFDGAMARVINNIEGELCDEFAKGLKEIRMGIERKVALTNISERCDVKELTMLINSLIQADELGVSLGRVLRIEAANLREHRKQMAREKAMKAPIKMLFPLIFFIFPSIFIIILGPAVIRITDIFMAR